MPKLKNDFLEITLAENSPQLVQWKHIKSGKIIKGIVPGMEEAAVMYLHTNQGIVEGDQLACAYQGSGQEISYSLSYKNLHGSISFTWRFILKDNNLFITIDQVEESGNLQFISLDSDLLWIASCEDKNSWVMTDDWFLPYKKYTHSHTRAYGLGAIGGKKWSIFLWSNKPHDAVRLDWVTWPHYPKIHRWNCISNSVYHYRLKGEIQPPLSAVAGWVEDENNDGTVDWQDVAIRLRDFLPGQMLPLYANTFVTKISTASPPNITKTTFDECLDITKELLKYTQGTYRTGFPKMIIYLSGWQYEGHDSKWPATGEACARCGGKEALVKLIEEADKLGVNISFHLNFDDIYRDSPDWDPRIVAKALEGQLQKGPVWGGGQCYRLCPYHDVKFGYAEKRIDLLLKLFPLKETIHIDVLSWAADTTCYEPEDPARPIENLVLGKYKVIEMFNHRGLDVTSEGLTMPFVGTMSYQWHLDSGYTGKLFNHLCRGKVAFGTTGEYSISEKNFDARARITESMLQATTNSWNFKKGQPLELWLDIYYLQFLPWQRLCHLPLLQQEQKGDETKLVFTDGSYIKGNQKELCYEVYEKGRLIAKSFSIFLPVTRNKWVAYSRPGGKESYPLPEGWQKKKIKSSKIIGETDADSSPKIEIKDDQIILNLPSQRGVIIEV